MGAIMNRIRGGMWNLPACRILNALAFGLAVWAIITPLYGLAALVAMLVGQAPGWGRYIGALGGWEKKKLEEWKPVDFLIKPLRSNIVAWGFAGMTLRGGFWGGCIALVASSWFPLLAGLTMGACYYATIEACRALKTKNPNGDGWEWGEVVFGCILWGSTGVAMMV